MLFENGDYCLASGLVRVSAGALHPHHSNLLLYIYIPTILNTHTHHMEKVSGRLGSWMGKGGVRKGRQLLFGNAVCSFGDRFVPARPATVSSTDLASHLHKG